MDDQNKSEDIGTEKTEGTKIQITDSSSDSGATPAVNGITPPEENINGESTVLPEVSGIEAEELAVQEMVEPVGVVSVPDTEVNEIPGGEPTESNNQEAEAPLDFKEETAETTPDEVQAEPAVEATPSATIASSGSFNAAPTGATPASAEVSSNNSEAPVAKTEHRNNRKLAVFITIFVALVLAGAVVYVYLSAEENTNKIDNSQLESTNQSTTEDTSPATAEDVDQASSEIDETLNSMDDNSDFNEESLSDSNLGIE